MYEIVYKTWAYLMMIMVISIDLTFVLIVFFNPVDNCSEKRTELSLVIINPNCDLKLEEGDIM